MKLLWHVTLFGQESALTALTSSRMDGQDLTSARATLSEKKHSPHLALVYFGRARRDVKDVTVSGV